MTLRLASPLVAPAECFYEDESDKAGADQHQGWRRSCPDLALILKTPRPSSQSLKIEGPKHQAEREFLADIDKDENCSPCQSRSHQRKMNRDKALERSAPQGACCVVISDRDKRLGLPCHLDRDGDVGVAGSSSGGG